MSDARKVPVATLRPFLPLRGFASEPVDWLRSEIERLFDDFGGPGRSLFSFPQRGAPAAVVPAFDMVEEEKAYRLTAELPGLDEKDLTIDVAEGVLTISGEKKTDDERQEGGVVLSERRYGSFKRQISLPADVDPDNIKARFQRGVLTLTMGKDEKAAARKRSIAIEAD